jgi:hypothetical protein
LLDQAQLRIVDMNIEKLSHSNQWGCACKCSVSGQSSQTGLQ